jgi:hypothetical protein
MIQGLRSSSLSGQSFGFIEGQLSRLAMASI